jgi:hypothetical protein
MAESVKPLKEAWTLLLSFLQINTSLLKSLSHINWPPEFVALLSFFDTLFFSLLDGNFLSEAVGNRANAANVTVFFCIGFLIFAAAVPTFYWLWVKLRRVPAKMREPFYDACIKVIVVMLFIFFPILSRNLLRLFLSRDINDTRLLSDDPRILYDSVGGWRVAASLFLALYTVGIPVYFFSCLWTAARPASQSYRSERQMRKYGLLFQKYEPEAWWWEMVELVRKLLLTSCLAFIAPGSLAQIFSGILLSLLALVLLAFFTPFVDARLDAVSVSCQVATCWCWSARTCAPCIASTSSHAPSCPRRYAMTTRARRRAARNGGFAAGRWQWTRLSPYRGSVGQRVPAFAARNGTAPR